MYFLLDKTGTLQAKAQVLVKFDATIHGWYHCVYLNQFGIKMNDTLNFYNETADKAKQKIEINCTLYK